MRPAIHFVGFVGEEYLFAVRVFGRPDFYHPSARELHRAFMAPGDTVVFARGCERHVDPDVLALMTTA